MGGLRASWNNKLEYYGGLRCLALGSLLGGSEKSLRVVRMSAHGVVPGLTGPEGPLAASEI